MGIDQLQKELQAQQRAVNDLLRQALDLDPTARAVIDQPHKGWEVARSTALDLLVKAEFRIEYARLIEKREDGKAIELRQASEKIDLARRIITALQRGRGPQRDSGTIAP